MEEGGREDGGMENIEWRMETGDEGNGKQRRRERDGVLEHIAVGFPPTVANYSHQGQLCCSKIDDPGVQGFGWFFTHLLGGFGTNGTLCPGQIGKHHQH